MGCGCAKKIARSKAKINKRKLEKRAGSAVRKRRVSKLISIPGKSTKRKIKKS